MSRNRLSIVCCISFNYYGTRLALSTADQVIQIWNFEGGVWQLSHKFSAHYGAIFKVRWAHPEFGSLLASCSFDKAVNIYEENAEDQSWNTLATLIESKEPVEDIQFSPQQIGLKLATCSANGEIRLYEPSNPGNQKVWSVINAFTASPLGSNVIAWEQGICSCPSLLVGNNDVTTASIKFCRTFDVEPELIQLWTYSGLNKCWEKRFWPSGHDAAVVDICWAPLMGRSKHIASSCSLDGVVIVWRIDMTTSIMEIEHRVQESIECC